MSWRLAQVILRWLQRSCSWTSGMQRATQQERKGGVKFTRHHFYAVSKTWLYAFHPTWRSLYSFSWKHVFVPPGILDSVTRWFAIASFRYLVFKRCHPSKVLKVQMVKSLKVWLSYGLVNAYYRWGSCILLSWLGWRVYVCVCVWKWKTLHRQKIDLQLATASF